MAHAPSRPHCSIRGDASCEFFLNTPEFIQDTRAPTVASLNAALRLRVEAAEEALAHAEVPQTPPLPDRLDLEALRTDTWVKAQRAIGSPAWPSQ